MLKISSVAVIGLLVGGLLIITLAFIQPKPLASQIQGTWASESGYPLMYLTGYRSDPPIFFVDYDIRARIRVHIEASYWDVDMDKKRVQASWPDPEANLESDGKCLALFELDKDLLTVQCPSVNTTVFKRV